MFWNSTRGGQSAVLRHDRASLKGPAERSGRSHSTVGGNATAGFSSRAEGVALAWAGVLHNGQGEETVWTRTESDGAWKPWGTVTCADWTVTDA